MTANNAMMRASILSVFANWLMAPAKPCKINAKMFDNFSAFHVQQLFSTLYNLVINNLAHSVEDFLQLIDF